MRPIRKVTLARRRDTLAYTIGFWFLHAANILPRMPPVVLGMNFALLVLVVSMTFRRFEMVEAG